MTRIDATLFAACILALGLTGLTALEAYRASEGFDWAVMTPARAALTPSERTGR